MQPKVVFDQKFVWLLFKVISAVYFGSAQNTDECHRALISPAALHSHVLL